MSETLMRAAQAEAARLEAELKATQTYRRLSAVRDLIAVYSARVEAEDEALPTPVTATRTSRATVRPGSQAASLTAAAEAYLRKIGRRAQTAEILEYLQANGTTFTSNKPLGSLSSSLSHHALFDNKRGLGYGLAEWGGSDTAPGSSGLFDDLRSPNIGSKRGEGHTGLDADLEIDGEAAEEAEAPAT